MATTPHLRAKKVKVTGGMSPTWISDILKEGSVSSVVESKGKSLLRTVDAKTKAFDSRAADHGNFGSKVLRGMWGSTFVLWPRNSLAVEGKSMVKSAIAAAGLTVNPKKRGL